MGGSYLVGLPWEPPTTPFLLNPLPTFKSLYSSFMPLPALIIFYANKNRAAMNKLHGILQKQSIS